MCLYVILKVPAEETLVDQHLIDLHPECMGPTSGVNKVIIQVNYKNSTENRIKREMKELE